LRGYLQHTLSPGIGFWWAALLLSVVFALGHVDNSGESPLGIVDVVTVSPLERRNGGPGRKHEDFALSDYGGDWNVVVVGWQNLVGEKLSPNDMSPDI
jgi:membrane protease YdiL (CAAX protease family)